MTKNTSEITVPTQEGANLVGQWPSFSNEEVEAVGAVLRSGRTNYWTGSLCRKLEEEFAKYCEAGHAIALANGTVALELALEAAGIGDGDDVVVTPRTFIASASCVTRLGGRPVFADVSWDSQNVTPESVEQAITERTRAIIAVHHAGWPCDMEGLMSVARKNDLVLIEDCAQAHGAKFKGHPVGGLGHIGVFSFCQDKIMTTGGEGGMLVTSDEAIWKRAWSIKDHGKIYDVVYQTDHAPGFRWLHDSFGTNFRMTEMQAAIGQIQLQKLEQWNSQRNENAIRIVEALSKYPSIRVPRPADDVRHAYYRLYAFIEPDRLSDGWDRDRIMSEITEGGIPCFSGSCPEIYNEKAFEEAGLRPERPMEVARALGPLSLAFLVHPTLTEDDLDRTCQVIDGVLSEATN